MHVRPQRGSGSKSTTVIPGTGLQQSARGPPLALPGLGDRVIVQRHRRLDALGEGEIAALQPVGEELGGVALGERHLRLQHLVVELDARRAPHHHLARRHRLQQLDRVVGVALARGLLAAAVMLDAAAVGRPAGRHVVEPQPVEHRGGRLDQVRGAEHVAAQVEDDVVALAVARGRQEPRALVLLRQEILGELDLTEVLRVVERHRRSPSHNRAVASVSSRGGAAFYPGVEGDSMNFGVWIPNCRHLATPDIIRGSGVRAEQLGYDSVWVSDHVVVPHANVVNFGETIFDPLVTLGVVAGATRRVRLGTTVLIVPYRNAVVTAKMISSLDALSGGRVVFGDRRGLGGRRERRCWASRSPSAGP